MNLVKSLLKNVLRKFRTASPPHAYDLLAADYDASSGNLMVALDDELFQELLQKVPVAGKIIVDFGCGTGRHWQRLQSLGPAQLVGYDASDGMLAVLKAKFPGAEAYHVAGCSLGHTGNHAADLVVSTLTIHYLMQLEPYFGEWDRVLKPGGHVLITGYHPDSLQSDGVIHFSHRSGTIAVRHNHFSLAAILELAAKRGWIPDTLIERRVDDSVKHFYTNKNALSAYERAKGKAIIYGLLLRKKSTAGFA